MGWMATPHTDGALHFPIELKKGHSRPSSIHKEGITGAASGTRSDDCPKFPISVAVHVAEPVMAQCNHQGSQCAHVV